MTMTSLLRVQVGDVLKMCWGDVSEQRMMMFGWEGKVSEKKADDVGMGVDCWTDVTLLGQEGGG